MGKHITIQEGGIAKQLTVDKLKTNLVGSGTCLWVPEDEVQLTTKTITENGTYKASDDGYYGYEQVIVSIAGVGTATGTDGDGDEAVAHTDPETGELVTDKVPSRIEVIEPPTNPYGIYTNGQSISTNGMVVKAYLASGGEYGTVPNGEITIDPATATYDSSTDYGPSGTATSDIISDSVLYGGTAIQNRPDGVRNEYTGAYCAAFPPYPNDPGRIGIVFASANNPVAEYKEVDPDGTERNQRTLNGTAYTYNNKTVYYYGIASTPSNETFGTWSIPMNSSKPGTNAQIAWTMIYGEKTEERAGSHQTIKVSWPRPLDGKVLETTFEILVRRPTAAGKTKGE